KDNTEASRTSGEKTPARLATPGEKISGELKEKDLRYVIVQLPDEEGGSASGSREAQRGKSRQAAMCRSHAPTILNSRAKSRCCRSNTGASFANDGSIGIQRNLQPHRGGD